jgi:hypothetical protein
LVAQLREEVDQRQWTWTAMADGALPQARRRRASQISRKIEFGMDQEIAETGISEAGFRLLTTAEQRKRLNRHLAPLGMHKGEQIKARDIRRFWQRRRLG